MSDENSLECQLREVLAHTEPLTLQALEDEIMKMLTYLCPFPIKMKRVKGVMYEHGFVIVDETSREQCGLEGEDIAYSWDVGDEHTNGLNKLFTGALYEALEDRTEKLLEDGKVYEVVLAGLALLEANRKKGILPEGGYKRVLDGMLQAIGQRFKVV